MTMSIGNIVALFRALLLELQRLAAAALDAGSEILALVLGLS